MEKVMVQQWHTIANMTDEKTRDQIIAMMMDYNKPIGGNEFIRGYIVATMDSALQFAEEDNYFAPVVASLMTTAAVLHHHFIPNINFKNGEPFS